MAFVPGLAPGRESKPRQYLAQAPESLAKSCVSGIHCRSGLLHAHRIRERSGSAGPWMAAPEPELRTVLTLLSEARLQQVAVGCLWESQRNGHSPGGPWNYKVGRQRNSPRKLRPLNLFSFPVVTAASLALFFWRGKQL